MRRLARTLATFAVAATLTLPAGRADAAIMRCPEWEHLFARRNLPVQTFSYLAWRESRCTANVISTTNDYGGLQLNAVIWQDMAQRPWLWGDTARRCRAPSPSAALRIRRNVCVAAQLYRIAGLTPWGIR